MLYLLSKGKIPIPRFALQTFLREHMFYPMDVQFKDLYLVPFPHFFARTSVFEVYIIMIIQYTSLSKSVCPL